jgi:hypothetical protein
VKQRDLAMKAFRTCKVIGYGIIVGSGLARKCAYAAKVLGRVDDRWARYVNGTETGTLNFPIAVQGQVARRVPFDGIVSNELSRYPGLSDPTRMIPVLGVNHQNLYSTRASLDQVTFAMKLFGMVGTPPPALSASISGPNSLLDGVGGTWTAAVIGGVTPYTYQWSGMLSGTASRISGEGSGTLKLDVWDASGKHAGATRTVTVKACTPGTMC